MTTTRFRVRFTKTDDLRWIGHMDLSRLWERLMRRAGLNLAMSAGFHPKPKISFPSALALGVEGLDEVVELEIVGNVVLEEVHAKLSENLQPGLGIVSIEHVEPSQARLPLRASTFEVEIPADLVQPTKQRIEALLAPGIWEVTRENRKLVARVGDPDFEVVLLEEPNLPPRLKFTLPNSGGASFRPGELLEALGLTDLTERGSILRRTRVHLGKQIQAGKNASEDKANEETEVESDDMVDSDASVESTS